MFLLWGYVQPLPHANTSLTTSKAREPSMYQDNPTQCTIGTKWTLTSGKCPPSDGQSISVASEPIVQVPSNNSFLCSSTKEFVQKSSLLLMHLGEVVGGISQCCMPLLHAPKLSNSTIISSRPAKYRRLYDQRMPKCHHQIKNNSKCGMLDVGQDM